MKTIEFTRVNNDTNGNPRYVCHFLDIPLTEQEKDSVDNPKPRLGKYGEIIKDNRFGIERHYDLAVKKANSIGGKKYHNKQYGGGIVFQSYNIQQTEKDIISLLNL